MATAPVTTLVALDKRQWRVLNWSETAGILMRDQEGAYWRLDPATGEITERKAIPEE